MNQQNALPPRLEALAPNRDDLAHVARAETTARRSVPAAVARLARWLDAGRRMIGEERAP